MFLRGVDRGGIFWQMIFSSPLGYAIFSWRIIVSERIRPGKKKVPPQFFSS